MLRTASVVTALALLAGGGARADPSVAGCADGTREGFTDVVAYADIAACDGGWDIPGVNLFNPAMPSACPGTTVYNTLVPACGRQGGNDGANPGGAGCNVADICADGWEVCTGAAQVMAATGGEGTSAIDGISGKFWTTRQSSNGCNKCALGTSTASNCNSASCANGCLQTEALSNDLYGGGGAGNTVSCGGLNRASGNNCDATASQGFSCSSFRGLCEVYTMTHPTPSGGGVLCCRSAPDEADIVPGATFLCSDSSPACAYGTASSATNEVTLDWSEDGAPCLR